MNKIAFIIILISFQGFACLDEIVEIMSPKTFDEKVVKKISTSEFFSPEKKEELLEQYIAMEVREADRAEFLDYIEYLESYQGLFQKNAVLEMQHYAKGSKHIVKPFSPIARFKKVQKKVVRYDEKMDAKMEEEKAIFGKRLKDPEKRKARFQEIESHYSGKKQLYRDMQYGCVKHQAKTAFNTVKNRMSFSTMFLGTFSPVVVYPTLANQFNEEIDFEPYRDEVIYTAIQNFLFHYTVIHLGKNFWSASAYSYAFYVSFFSLYRYFWYSKQYGLEPQAEELFEKMKLEGFEEQMNEIIARQENSKAMLNLGNALKASMDNFELDGKNIMKAYENGELSDEEVRDMFIEVLANDIYESKSKDSLIKTGAIWSDHVAAYAINDFYMVFLDVFVTKSIMSMICSTLPNKKMALLKSMGAYFAWSLGYNASLYGFRILTTGSIK